MTDVRLTRLYECAIYVMQRKLKISSDGHCRSKKFKQGYDGVWRSLESQFRFCLGASGKNLVSVTAKIFFTFK